MNDDIQKRFPTIRWAICCFSGSAWVLLMFSEVKGVFEYPAGIGDRNFIISFILLAYLVVLPKGPERALATFMISP